MSETGVPRATFTSMADSTAGDCAIISAGFPAFAQQLPDRVLAHLRLLAGDHGGFAVDRLTHSLQTATLAQRGGEDEEYVVCALLHDIGDTLAPYNHADLAAAILKPFVSPENRWVVEKHAVFQGYHYWHHYGLDRHGREAYRGHPWFAQTARFCDEWDQVSFDPGYDTMPLSAFEPMIHRLFAQPRYEFASISPA